MNIGDRTIKVCTKPAQFIRNPPRPALFEDRSYFVRVDHYGWPFDNTTRTFAVKGEVPKQIDTVNETWTVRRGNIGMNAVAGILILVAAGWMIERMERAFRALKIRFATVRSDLKTNV